MLKLFLEREKQYSIFSPTVKSNNSSLASSISFLFYQLNDDDDAITLLVPPVQPAHESKSSGIPRTAELPRMLPASHPLLYACVFRDSAIVAELGHDPDDAGTDGLPALTAALAAAAPPHHRYVTHSVSGRAHALLLAPPLALAAVSLAPQLPSSHLLLFLRRLRCIPEHRMREEMARMALHLPFPDDEALAREAAEVAVVETEAEEEARREGDLARRTPKREGGTRGGGRTWRRQLWLVVLADLVLLGLLFAAWLAVCRGFSCIGR